MRVARAKEREKKVDMCTSHQEEIAKIDIKVSNFLIFCLQRIKILFEQFHSFAFLNLVFSFFLLVKLIFSVYR